ncbi:MAG: HNH endonuclease [Cellulomonas sp.]|nr:HNH endonuclease [Cellulomonas sp.]
MPVWSRARAAARYPVSASDVAGGQAALRALSVRAPASDAGYDRSRFGTAWADIDRNGCDTRNDVLRRDLTAVVLKAGAHGCVVQSGTLADPYTGTTIRFVRGSGSAAVQIDHVVALDAAWRTGAQAWSATRREAFANDPANLLAVDGHANQDKGAADAGAWLPPDPGYRCVYAMRQVRVKAAYGLWVTRTERDALAGALDGCVVAR